MNNKIIYWMPVLLLGFGFLFVPDAMAAIQRPSFVSGDGAGDVDAMGSRAAEIFTIIVGVIAALATLVASGFFVAGKTDVGKTILVGVVIGLVVAVVSGGAVFYIVGD